MSRFLIFLIFLLLIAATAMAAEVPPTIPHPGINGQNGYTIGVVNRDTRTLDLRAPYLHDTPYDDGTGWRNGDRIGYNCGYGFIEHQPSIGPAELFGRFTFRLIPQAQSYGQINDSFMEEPNDDQTTAGGPSRYYDGTPNTTGFQASSLECPAVTESYVAVPGVDDRDKAIFWLDGQAREIRDYLFADSAPGVTFDFLDPITTPFTVTGTDSGVSTVNNRQPVLIIDHGVPIAVVYYDGIGRGSVIAPTETGGGPNPDDCNMVVSMSQGRQVYTGTPNGSSNAAIEAATGEQWMFGGSGGKVLQWFTIASNWDTLGILHRCGPDAEIDRVVLIFDPREPQGQNHMTQYLNQVLAIVGSRYPGAEAQFVLLVGAEGHVSCDPVVKAAQTHAARIDELNLHPDAGPDLDIPCSQYSDTIGHLGPEGAASANGQLGAAYSGG
jgi:hypothetical protein